MQPANTKKRKNGKEEEGDDKALTLKPCSSSTTKRSKIIHVAKKEPRFTSTAQVVAELLNCRPDERGSALEFMGPNAPINKDWQETIRFLLSEHFIPDVTAIIASYIPHALSALFVSWKREDDEQPHDESDPHGIIRRFGRLIQLSTNPSVVTMRGSLPYVYHLWRVASTDASWCFGPVDSLSRYLMEHFRKRVATAFSVAANADGSAVIEDDELNDRFDDFNEDTDANLIVGARVPITKEVIWFFQQIGAATSNSSTAPATEIDFLFFEAILSVNRVDLLSNTDVRRSDLPFRRNYMQVFNHNFLYMTRLLYDSDEHKHIAESRYIEWYMYADEQLENVRPVQGEPITAELLANHRMNYLREFFLPSDNVSDEKMRYYARIPEQYIKEEDWIHLNRPCQTCGRPRAFTFLVPDKDECDICTRAASAVSPSNGGDGGFSDHDVKLDQV